jgi:hypothetical protein
MLNVETIAQPTGSLFGVERLAEHHRQAHALGEDRDLEVQVRDVVAADVQRLQVDAAVLGEELRPQRHGRVGRHLEHVRAVRAGGRRDARHLGDADRRADEPGERGVELVRVAADLHGVAGGERAGRGGHTRGHREREGSGCACGGPPPAQGG